MTLPRIAAPLQERDVVREHHCAEVEAALGVGEFARADEICRAAAEDGEDAKLGVLHAVVLHRMGRSDEGIARLRELVEREPGSASAYANLGELQRAKGAFDAAIDALDRASQLDPENHLIWFNLGRAYLAAGDKDRAVECYRTALNWSHGSLFAHRALVSLLKEVAQPGEFELENRCLQLAELAAPSDRVPDHTFRLRSALQGARRALRFAKGHPDALLVMGKLLNDVEQFAMAITALEPLARRPDAHRDVLVALSVAYAGEKRWREARAATAAFARTHVLGSRVGAKTEADVLVLEALYNPAFERPASGPVPLVYGSAVYARRGWIGDLSPDRVSYHHCYIDEVDLSVPELQREFDVIYNNVGFAEVNQRRNYKEAVRLIVRATGLPVINAPDKIDGTSRSANYQALRSLEHAIFPKTLSYPVNAIEIEDSIRNIVHEFTFPVLVRSRIHAAPRAFYKADEVDELRAAVKRISPNGKEQVYVIQYHESRHPSGAFLRYRLAFVDGVLYPGALDLSDGWLKRANEGAAWAAKLGSALMAEERRWLDDPEAVIGAENLAALGAANAKLGLDILGMTIGIDDHGKAIIFEANAHTSPFGATRPADGAPHLVPATRRIQAAIEDLMVRKSRPAAASA